MKKRICMLPAIMLLLPLSGIVPADGEEEADAAQAAEREKLAEAGDAEAQYHIGKCYLRGYGVANDHGRSGTHGCRFF